MKEIGKGATKTVYLSSFNGRPVAVNTPLDPYEVSMLKEVEGIPNCLKLIDVTEDSFLTEYCDRGDPYAGDAPPLPPPRRHNPHRF